MNTARPSHSLKVFVQTTLESQRAPCLLCTQSFEQWGEKMQFSLPLNEKEHEPRPAEISQLGLSTTPDSK